jgi:predicted nucleotidyltransferase
MSVLAAVGAPGIVVGAFARDLHLHYGAGIPVQRGTEDIDFAFAVGSWPQFSVLRERLLQSGAFGLIEGKQHRLRHSNGIAVDLVPFGSIETKDRQIAWPPTGDIVMDVFGFQESLATAEHALVPNNVKLPIVSLPALALLKIVAWSDRHCRFPGKDAADLSLIVRNYLAVAANKERLWSDFIEWTQSPDFDYEQGGARMLGHDMRQLVDDDGLRRISDILNAQLEDGKLSQEMERRSPEQASALLWSLCRGLGQ